MPRPWIVLCCLTVIACDRKSPPSPPVVATPVANETVNGTERIGWDQPAGDAVELATIGYVVYVDGTRTELAGATCASAAAAGGFPCTARLPAMSAGPHTLELASLVNDGGVLESARSAPLRVTLVAPVVSAASIRVPRSGLRVRAAPVAEGLEAPTDLAFAPDGRLFIAERAGRIRIISGGRLLKEPALSLGESPGANIQLLALALDPLFARTHYVYALYAALARSGELAFTLGRFREVSNTLGDRAVLLDAVPASSPSPSAALRFGPDGKLYAAFDDGGDPRRRRDAASVNGKVLRLDADGTTPSDAHGGTPVYAEGYGSPVALDWDPTTGTLWVADRAAGASVFVFYRGALFPAWNGRLLSAGTLFERGPAGAGPIAVGPDGAIYYGTAGAVGRLDPDRGP